MGPSVCSPLRLDVVGAVVEGGHDSSVEAHVEGDMRLDVGEGVGMCVALTVSEGVELSAGAELVC